MTDIDLCPIVIMRSTGPRYSLQTIINALPPKVGKVVKKANTIRTANRLPDVTLTDAQRVIVAQTVAEMQSDHPVLWQGKFDQFGARRGGGHYEGQSDADLALVGYAAKALAEKVSSAHELMVLSEAVMGHSVLASRDKWQDRPDYRERTISKACGDVEIQPLVDWSLSGDVRNARAFARMCRGALLYVHGVDKWLIWQNDRWQWCDKDEPLAAAKDVATKLVKLAANELQDDPDKAKRLIREATAASNLPKLMAMLTLGKSELGMGVAANALDTQARLLGVINGVVDLRMGFLLPNKPEMLITQHCAARFDKSAKCSLWLQALDQVFQGDTATIKTFQILLGMTLTGEVGEEFIIFVIGFGANGKSLLSNVVTAIIGEYAKTVPSSLLAARRGDDHSPRSDLAMLNGARLVSINELPAGMQLNEQMVKQIAGREPISARFLHKEFFTFLPRFTTWVRTNHKPIVKGDDDGIWRRIIPIPFRRKFAPHEQDPKLEAKLLAERDGILMWMIEGAMEYYRNGITLSPAIKREQAKYRKDSDMLGEFLGECTDVDPSSRVKKSDLYQRWKYWCDTNGVQPGAKKSFTQRLEERGFVGTQSNGVPYYRGLTLKSAIHNHTGSKG
jgi:putative DNA primase/helicase